MILSLLGLAISNTALVVAVRNHREMRRPLALKSTMQYMAGDVWSTDPPRLTRKESAP